jgi:nucleobase:cation symporter-1, NCS1 family
MPESLKTVKWYDISFIVVKFIVNPAQILIAGLAVAAGLSFWAAVAAITGAVLIVYIPYLIMATVGVDYGLPGLVSTRMVFGIRGAKWISSLVGVIGSVFFFALHTIAGAVAINAGSTMPGRCWRLSRPS